MLRWSVMATVVGASLWIATTSCGLDTQTRSQPTTNGSDGGVVIVPDATVVLDDAGSAIVPDATIFMDAGSAIVPDATLGADAGSIPDAGSGSSSTMGDAGVGPPDASAGSGSSPDAAIAPADAGAGMDARHGGNPDTLDQTSFYTCASCGTGTDARFAIVLVVGVGLVLRRRRR